MPHWLHDRATWQALVTPCGIRTELNTAARMWRWRTEGKKKMNSEEDTAKDEIRH